jgi:NAD(P)-dependent dehydrogenase (short-subunit alcohol dehydrogenase family)
MHRGRPRRTGTSSGWTAADIPDLVGRTAVVTGANSGIGLETAAALSAAGATVVLACRNPERAEAAKANIESRRGSGPVEVLTLDLADQTQIAAAADEALDRFPRIDRLINNAGVMAIPFSRTVDGFETVFGTNHLGHFAFTGRILPALLATPRSRVVTVASQSYRLGRIRWHDLDAERGYSQARAYAQAKLANLLFAFELQRRLVLVGAHTISLAAHPGSASTEIGSNALSRMPRWDRQLRAVGERFLASATDAALPALRAATSPDAYGGQFYGPGNFGGMKGPPVTVSPARRALDEQAQARLWDLSVALTGVDLPQR